MVKLIKIFKSVYRTSICKYTAEGRMYRMKKSAMNAISLVFLFAGFILFSCTPQPIKVGFIGGLSGFNSDLGISGRNGVSLAIDAVNKQGGIKGRKLELLVRDDKQDPEVARAVFRELVSEQVVAVIGPMTSGIAQVLIPLANEAQLPLISPTASSPDFSGLDDLFIRVVTPNTNEALGLAMESFRRGVKKPCIFEDLSNQAFCQVLSRAYMAELRRLSETGGAEISEITLPYDPKDPGTTNTWLIALERYQPDLVLFTTNSLDTAILAQRIRQRGFSMPFLGTGWAMSQSLIENGGKAVEGMVFTVPFNPESESEAWRIFTSEYKQAFGKEADFGAAQGWTAAQVLAQALSTKGPKKIKENIINRSYQGLQGPLYIDGFGDPVIPFQRLEIENGRLVSASEP